VLRLAGPAASQRRWRHSGYTVRLSGTLTTDLVVTVASTLPARLTVPPTALIPAGQTSAVFTASIVDNAF